MPHQNGPNRLSAASPLQELRERPDNFSVYFPGYNMVVPVEEAGEIAVAVALRPKHITGPGRRNPGVLTTAVAFDLTHDNPLPEATELEAGAPAHAAASLWRPSLTEVTSKTPASYDDFALQAAHTGFERTLESTHRDRLPGRSVGIEIVTEDRNLGFALPHILIENMRKQWAVKKAYLQTLERKQRRFDHVPESLQTPMGLRDFVEEFTQSSHGQPADIIKGAARIIDLRLHAQHGQEIAQQAASNLEARRIDFIAMVASNALDGANVVHLPALRAA